MNLNTATVSLAVTPTVVSTLLTHYLKRKPLRHRPTAHLSYDEGLHLIRSFLIFASHHTVEELQAFTSQWVPHPQWVKVEEVRIPDEQLLRAAALLEEQLGPDGIRRVGGRKWWQWRKPNSPLKAEWIEMRADYNERKRSGEPCRRVMLYVHGGAYFFGSVDEHRYQMQRHARKLKARIIAPKYRLAPQFPFPCGLQDCLATYLNLLESGQQPNTIILAGDSAGGGMVLSVLVTLRDRGIPLPAGAVLISPWVDLTHSFPSVAAPSTFDYIPQCGFHHKPSESWPPPTNEQLKEMKSQATNATKVKSDCSETSKISAPETQPEAVLSVLMDGKVVEIQEQIQMYTTNELLSHPLVSPILQPTLGGLPPLFIMVGGGEILRDEQIYLAHKCADPEKHQPPESLFDDAGKAALKKFKPTDVQLQVWDDMCHVAPTLSFTRPAKYMYRSIAQFGAWALAHAQRTEIDILDDDEISVISTSGSDSDEEASGESQPAEPAKDPEKEKERDDPEARIGKAGDALPPFREHMIRQRVTRHGDIFPLAPASELPACCQDRELIGCPKKGPVGRWLEAKAQFSNKHAGLTTRIHKKRLRALAVGYETFGEGEAPPPSALAGRRRIGADLTEKKRTRSMGMSLWSLWGSKHDEMTVQREEQADREPETKTPALNEGAGARAFSDIQRQDAALSPPARPGHHERRGSRHRIVRDENQADGDTPVAELIAQRREKEAKAEAQAEAEAEASGGAKDKLLKPETGVAGKRPYVGGISLPFTLRKEADTASMLTLTSGIEAPSTGPATRPMSPATTTNSALDKDKDATTTTAAAAVAATEPPQADTERDQEQDQETPTAAGNGAAGVAKARTEALDVATPLTPGLFATPLSSPGEARPHLEKFVTAQEDLPRVAQKD